MTREQLEHAIRAACDIADDDEVIIIGSQAILGQYPNSPDDLTQSVEVDLYPKNRPERAILVDGAIGEVEAHDLAASKLAAGREKDRDFVAALLRHAYVRPDTLRRLASDLPIPEKTARDLMLARLDAMVSRVRIAPD